MGTTRRGTPVYLNSTALESDKLILTGGVTCHSMAGYGGGRKSVVPGIRRAETINANHCQVLRPGFGNGIHAGIRCGCMDETNPMHEDLMEAAAFAKPDYLVNIVVGGEHQIVKAFAGDWVQAHRAATELVDQLDSVSVRARCDYAIVSAGGATEGHHLYQSSKALANVSQMVKPGGTIVMMAECPEGFGDPDCARQITDLKRWPSVRPPSEQTLPSAASWATSFTLTAERFRFISSRRSRASSSPTRRSSSPPVWKKRSRWPTRAAMIQGAALR